MVNMPHHTMNLRKAFNLATSCWQSSWSGQPHPKTAAKTVSSSLSMACMTWSRCPLTPATHFVRWFGQTYKHFTKSDEVTPGITKEEYKRRRTSLVSLARNKSKEVKTTKDHIFVFPSASKVFMSNDIPYPFRQNSNFLYLCGFQEPDSVLVISSSCDHFSSDDNHESVLFVPKKDPDKELWDGPRLGMDGAVCLTGVDSALNSEDLENYLAQYCSKHSQFILWYDYTNPVQPHLHSHIMCEMIHQERHTAMENTTPLLHQLRLKKSSAEIELMKQTVDIASQAFIEVMRFSTPGVNEAHLWAKMDFECRLKGAQYLAYPPVCAGGVRANTIHYISNNQVVADGELVLMDAGCEFHGYTSDVTRTWPINGEFTPPQRELYEATLSVQKTCIDLSTTTSSLDQIYRQMLVLLGAELQKIGILPSNMSASEFVKRTRELCPHHVGHYLGMDVHDTASISRSIKLQPGMVITIEPGIYIPVNDTSVPKPYRGIGIRIEDNILITEAENVNLSCRCPKEVEDIEMIIQGR